jgi:ParB-like chromosome segregation protein Spo0J
MVRPIEDEDYKYQLICGSRRLRNILRLIKEAKAISEEKRDFKEEELCYCPETAEWLPATDVYSAVKCFVRDCDDETAIRINIAENLEHSKLPELDLMEYCQELVDIKENSAPRYSRSEVADMCNRSESWVSLTLELNSLPDRVKTLMMDDRVTRTAALAFLQTEREKLDEVIEVGEEIVRKEKMAEAGVAETELHNANLELSDAVNDIEIHDMMQNTSLMQMATKRAGVARKRVSAASEKRDTALKEAENPKLTADVINKANLSVPGAKKGAPKAMPVKGIRELHTKFVSFKEKQTLKDNEAYAYNVVGSLFEVILGHRACDNVEELFVLKEELVEVS